MSQISIPTARFSLQKKISPLCHCFAENVTKTSQIESKIVAKHYLKDTL